MSTKLMLMKWFLHFWHSACKVSLLWPNLLMKYAIKKSIWLFMSKIWFLSGLTIEILNYCPKLNSTVHFCWSHFHLFKSLEKRNGNLCELRSEVEGCMSLLCMHLLFQKLHMYVWALQEGWNVRVRFHVLSGSPSCGASEGHTSGLAQTLHHT